MYMTDFNSNSEQFKCIIAKYKTIIYENIQRINQSCFAPDQQDKDIGWKPKIKLFFTKTGIWAKTSSKQQSSVR